jgi:hypothetical protein
VSTPRDAGAWFQEPVVWLAAAILGASIVGCIVLIVLAWRFPDAPVEDVGAKAMNVPVRHSTEDASPPRETR